MGGALGNQSVPLQERPQGAALGQLSEMTAICGPGGRPPAGTDSANPQPRASHPRSHEQ